MTQTVTLKTVKKSVLKRCRLVAVLSAMSCSSVMMKNSQNASQRYFRSSNRKKGSIYLFWVRFRLVGSSYALIESLVSKVMCYASVLLFNDVIQHSFRSFWRQTVRAFEKFMKSFKKPRMKIKTSPPLESRHKYGPMRAISESPFGMADICQVSGMKML